MEYVDIIFMLIIILLVIFLCIFIGTTYFVYADSDIVYNITYADLNHFSDITYDEESNSILLKWDFTDNIIQSCHLQTNLDGAGYTTVNFETYRFNMVGLDFENKRDGPSYLSYNLDSSKIDCKGEYTINIDDIISYTGTQRYNFEFFFGGIINDVNRDKIPIDFFKEYDSTSGLAYTHALGYEYNEYGTYRNLSCSEAYGYFDRFMYKTVIIQDIEKDTKQSISYEDCIGSSNNITVKKSSNGGCADCTPPTLGINENGQRLVSDGFTYNGKSVDVQRFFTPYSLITVDVGKLNKAEFKIYENQGLENIKHFSFAFGLRDGQIISESKTMIELDIDHEGTETVTVTDPENVLDQIKVTTSTVSCMDDSNTECLEISIQHRFRASLDFNIVATDVWDTKRNAWQNYYNHGIEVVGESLNPPKEYEGIEKRQLYHLTETSKTTAVDEDGNMWSFEYGLWYKDYIKVSTVDKPTDIMTREHSQFEIIREDQIELAMEKILEICPSCLL